MSPARPVLKKCGPDLLPVTVFGNGQSEYLPLPGLRGADGLVTTRWHLTWRERFRLLFYGDIWLQMLTFGRSIQPVKFLVNEPTPSECGFDIPEPELPA